jgi:hypothetical protein
MSARVDHDWLAPAPAERLAMLRILTGLFAWIYLCARIVYFSHYAGLSPEQFRPIGVASVLAEPLSTAITWSTSACAAIAGAAFVLGWRYRFSGPLFAALFLWITTYRSSWGMIFHTENLAVVHVAILSVAPAADAWSLDARGRTGGEDPRYGWPTRLMCAVTVLTYVMAGIAKLREAGIDWVTTDFLRNYVAYDALRKIELGSVHSPVGAFFASTAWLWKPLAGFSLAVELGAPVAMVSRRFATVWVLAALAFHVGVLVMMAIFFPYVVLGVGFASFFPVERLGSRLEARLLRWRTPAV